MSAVIVPGTREPGMLTTFGASVTSTSTFPVGPSTMDAVTIAEHQRAGGGAPGQRRPVRARLPWTGASGRLHGWLVATRMLFAWRVRTSHV